MHIVESTHAAQGSSNNKDKTRRPVISATDSNMEISTDLQMSLTKGASGHKQGSTLHLQGFIQWGGGELPHQNTQLPPSPPKEGERKRKRGEGECVCFSCYDILDHFKTR